MKITQLTGKPFEGIKFDGTFESAVGITEFVKDRSNFEKILKFRIDHSLSRTELSFTAARLKIDPNSESREFIFKIGDYLILNGAGFERMSADQVRKFFDVVN